MIKDKFFIKMKNSEIRKIPIKEIKIFFKKKKMQYIKTKYNHKIEHNKNPISIRYTRRFIARILTILHENKKNKSK